HRLAPETFGGACLQPLFRTRLQILRGHRRDRRRPDPLRKIPLRPHALPLPLAPERGNALKSTLTSLPPSDKIPRMAKPALGRGLGALLGGAPAKPAPLPSSNIIAQAPIPPGERVRQVALDRVRP